MPINSDALTNDTNLCSRLLPDEVFEQVIENAPLVAIDLLVEDQDHREPSQRG